MPVLIIRKKGKRNRQKYAIAGFHCPIGHPTIKFLRPDGRIMIFQRYDLEVCEIDFFRGGFGSKVPNVWETKK